MRELEASLGPGDIARGVLAEVDETAAVREGMPDKDVLPWISVSRSVTVPRGSEGMPVRLRSGAGSISRQVVRTYSNRYSPDFAASSYAWRGIWVASLPPLASISVPVI